MAYVQCPYCDSIQVEQVYQNQYRCDYCKRYFDYQGPEDKITKV